MKMDSMTRYRWQSAGYLGGEGDPDGGGDGSGCGCGCVIAFFVALVVIAYVSSFFIGS